MHNLPELSRIDSALRAANDKMKTTFGASVELDPCSLFTLMECTKAIRDMVTVGAMPESHGARATIDRLLEYIGSPMQECSDCGHISEAGDYMFPPDGVSVCPECRSVESFTELEVS